MKSWALSCSDWGDIGFLADCRGRRRGKTLAAPQLAQPLLVRLDRIGLPAHNESTEGHHRVGNSSASPSRTLRPRKWPDLPRGKRSSEHYGSSDRLVL
jgi:hypothetical protein